jgi:hypothetical protein
MLSRIHECLGVARALLRALLVLCFVLGAAGWANAASTSTQQSPGPSTTLNTYFAIADFDGDQKPDLATVEVQKGSSSGVTQYSIRFQMSAGAAQVFGVIAPAGGLQIVAQDVNGDDALDVLVSTVWQHKQVAVLLNDGHGKFTLADPAAFPAAFWGTEDGWNSVTVPICDSPALVRMEYPPGGFGRECRFDGLQGQFQSARRLFFKCTTQLFLFSVLGRAPPILFFQS